MQEKITTYKGLQNYINKTSKQKNTIVSKHFDYEGNKKYWYMWNLEMQIRKDYGIYRFGELFND